MAILGELPLHTTPVEIDTRLTDRDMPQVRMSNDGVGYVTFQGVTTLERIIKRLQDLVDAAKGTRTLGE
jgi:hypothetical protein